MGVLLADNSRKTPLADSLNRFATKRIADAIQITGRALPCTVEKVRGAIVTVSFQVTSQFTLPQVTMPVAGSEYARQPIQKGCKGFTIAADASLGGVNGLGAGQANMATQANLATLVFVPIGNAGWFTVDGNYYVMYGPTGVILRTIDDSVSLTITAAGVVIKGNLLVQGDTATQGNMVATGGIVAGFGGPDQVGVQTHQHPTAAVGAPSPPTPGT